MASADRARIGDIVNKPWPKFGPGPGGERHGGFGIGLGAGLDSVAKALGISNADLKTDLAKGQSIAQIAKSKNVDVNKVIDALVADANAKIDTAVKNGKLSQDRANTLKDAIRSAVTAFVNNGLPKPPAGMGGGFGFKFGGHHGFGPFGGHGFGPNTSAPNSTTTTTVKPASS
jgi:hypothetical protein